MRITNMERSEMTIKKRKRVKEKRTKNGKQLVECCLATSM